MRRYRLPAGTTPGDIPTSILEHRAPSLTHTYMALHALASLQDEWGPFTSQQLIDLMPSGGESATGSALEVELQRLAQLGYIEVEYLT